MNLIDNKRCFVCGKENESGLKIDFFIENRRIRAEFSIDNRFQGFSGIVHGGIISTILDEAMVKLAFGLGFSAVTANLNVNLRKPAKPNEKLIATGEIIGDFGRKIKAKSSITKEDGALVAEAEGLLVKCQKFPPTETNVS